MPELHTGDEGKRQGDEANQDAAANVFERGEERDKADRGKGYRVIFPSFGDALDAVKHFAEEEEAGDDFQRGQAVVGRDVFAGFHHDGKAFDVRSRVAVGVNALRLEGFHYGIEIFQGFHGFQTEDDGEDAKIKRIAGAEEVDDGAFEFVEVFVHGGSLWGSGGLPGDGVFCLARGYVTGGVEEDEAEAGGIYKVGEDDGDARCHVGDGVLQQEIRREEQGGLDKDNQGVVADAGTADGGNPVARIDHAENAVFTDKVHQCCGGEEPDGKGEQVFRDFTRQRVFAIDKGQGDREQCKAEQEEADVVFAGKPGGGDGNGCKGDGFVVPPVGEARHAVKQFAQAEVLHHEIPDPKGEIRWRQVAPGLGEEDADGEVVVVFVTVEDEEVNGENADAQVEEVGRADEVADGAFEVMEGAFEIHGAVSLKGSDGLHTG